MCLKKLIENQRPNSYKLVGIKNDLDSTARILTLNLYPENGGTVGEIQMIVVRNKFPAYINFMN